MSDNLRLMDAVERGSKEANRAKVVLEQILDAIFLHAQPDTNGFAWKYEELQVLAYLADELLDNANTELDKALTYLAGGERTPLKDGIIRLLSTADEQSMNLIYNFAKSLLKSKPAET